MTVNIAYAEAGDGYVESLSSTSYADARAGGTLSHDASGTAALYGQSVVAGTYYVYQAFARWTFSVPADAVVSSAAITLWQESAFTPSTSRTLELRQYDYGTLDAFDFRTPAQLNALPVLAELHAVQGAQGKYVTAGSAALRSAVQAGTSLGVVMGSSRARAGTSPFGRETAEIASADTSGTAKDPALVYVTAARSSLFGVVAAQARMDDGSWMALETNGAANPTMELRRRTGAGGGDSTLIAALSIGITPGMWAASAGYQNFALATNGTDRLWLLGVPGGDPNSLAVQSWTLSGGVWTAGTMRLVPLPAYTGRINAITATAIDPPDGGTEPDLLALIARSAGAANPAEPDQGLLYAHLSGAAVESGTGAILTACGSYVGTFGPAGAIANQWNLFSAETGSGLDMVRAGGRAAYLTAPASAALPGHSALVPLGRLDLDAGNAYTLTDLYASRDAGPKISIVAASGDSMCLATADASAGISVQHYQVVGGSWTPLSPRIDLGGEGIATMPAASALSTSPAWEAGYDPVTNKLWIYYAAADRTIRRTGVDLTTHQPDRSEVTVGTVGAVGSTNIALRVQHDKPLGTAELIGVANRTSGGVLSTSYLLDSFNTAPQAPLLVTRQNFDATVTASLAWTFRDPNPGDSQSAYRLEIVNASTAAVVLDTGKVASATPARTITGGTLSNGVTYQWRVMTWDSTDLSGPWSDIGTFTTSAGGTVTITDPAVDNQVGIDTDDYAVTWSAAGTVQAAYQVTLTLVSSGAVLSDSGWVASTATSHTVSGMASDTLYDVAVRVRNAALVQSSWATRRITPSYSTPEVPELTASLGPGGGYVLLQVTNPPPVDSDRPVVVRNEMFRRSPSAPGFVRIGEVEPNGSMRDYRVTSGVTYEYRVRAYS